MRCDKPPAIIRDTMCAGGHADARAEQRQQRDAPTA
jgi:hypothetical protein